MSIGTTSSLSPSRVPIYRARGALVETFVSVVSIVSIVSVVSVLTKPTRKSPTPTPTLSQS